MKLHSNIKMDTIFMNSENNKTSEPHILILKLTDKLGLRSGEKIIALSSISIYDTWKDIKSSYNNNKFKISALGMINLNLLMDCILYKIFNIFLNIFLKSMEKILINHQ